MQGPRNLPTSIQLHYHENDLLKHYKKLTEIHKTESKKKIDVEVGNKSKMIESREKTLKFHNSEKALNIEKENELLLGKLVEISRKKKPNLLPGKAENNHPGTLNGPSRRKEKDRIAMENEAFARRLLSQQPSFNRKKLEVEYGKHNDRVKHMSKMVGFSPRKIRLPPLRKEDFTLDEKKDHKESGKKKNPVQEREVIVEEDEKREVEEKEKEKITKEQKDKEEAEKAEKEEQGKKEKEAADKKLKEEQETQEKAEAEQKEKEENEKKEQEAEKKRKEEQEAQEAQEKAEKEKAEAQAKEQDIKEDIPEEEH